MKKLKIYLDTSVWNFFYADDAPEKKSITVDFYDQINRFDTYISNTVISEIELANESKKSLLLDLIKRYPPTVLAPDPEIERLTVLYLGRGIVPVKKTEDARHIAYSTFYEMDVLLSWNYKHLANVFRKKQIQIVNLQEGYLRPLDLITPLEVLGE